MPPSHLKNSNRKNNSNLFIWNAKIEARALREEKKHTANTIEEAAFWESRTINYMLLRFFYGGGRFQTFKEWKTDGAVIKKGAKAIVIWGQPKKGTPKDIDDTNLSEEEKELKKYEFFPLCYLFSEKDVVFPSAKEKEVKEENTPDKEKGIPAEIDNELINTL